MKTLEAGLESAIESYVKSFELMLYERDEAFLEGMKGRGLNDQEISRYEFWEWPQGVALFSLWKLFSSSQSAHCKKLLTEYYERGLLHGLPEKNVNTVCPLLALSYIAEAELRDDWLSVCREWAAWIMDAFPRTREGGFQHSTSDSFNRGELWDDTLFMTVLFLARSARLFHESAYAAEAEYQFLIHAKYLADRKSGLWYHGWTFEGDTNFTQALWGRGNAWITVGIPEFLEHAECAPSIRRFLSEVWKRQVESLLRFQDAGGLWHTLIDDPSSYLEASSSAGFAYGILRGIGLGLGPASWASAALKTAEAVLACTDTQGLVHQVSYGTPMGRTSKDFYKTIELRPMPYGQALALLLCAEALRFIRSHGDMR